MKFFCKLNQNIRSTSEILFKLHSTHGLVFLEDQNHPVIAFNPRHYVVYNNKQFKYFVILCPLAVWRFGMPIAALIENEPIYFPYHPL